MWMVVGDEATAVWEGTGEGAVGGRGALRLFPVRRKNDLGVSARDDGLEGIVSSVGVGEGGLSIGWAPPPPPGTGVTHTKLPVTDAVSSSLKGLK